MQDGCGADAAAEEGLPREAFFVVTLHADVVFFRWSGLPRQRESTKCGVSS